MNRPWATIALHFQGILVMRAFAGLCKADYGVYCMPMQVICSAATLQLLAASRPAHEISFRYSTTFENGRRSSVGCNINIGKAHSTPSAILSKTNVPSLPRKRQKEPDKPQTDRKITC